MSRIKILDLDINDPAYASEYQKDWRQKNPERARLIKEKSIAKKIATDPRKYLYDKVRWRAQFYNQEFTISEDDFYIPEFCPILGIKLEFGAKGHPRDFTPSLDRVDNTKGYIPGNVRVISYKANTLKREATLQEIENLYKYSKGLI